MNDPAARAPGATQDELAEIERGRRHLWRTAFAILISLSLVVVVVSYWSESLPDPIAGALDFAALRFVFLVLALGFIAYAVERERRFGAVTRAFVEERTRTVALQERLREVSGLAEMVREIADVREEPAMLQAVAGWACKLIGADRAVVLLADQDAGLLRPAASVGFPPEEPLRDVSLDIGPLADVVTAGGGLVSAASLGLEGSPITSAAAVPVTAHGELIGALWAGTAGGRLSEYELRLLSLTADGAAVAIANVRAYAHETETVTRLAELDTMKTELIATIAHELKTPLTSLLGYSTILRRRGDALTPAQRDEMFAIMSRQGERILRLIEELLQSSRIEVGAGRLRRDPLDLAAILNGVAEDLRAVGRDNRIEVTVPETDVGVYGDPTAIRHIVGNLVDNAIKYSPPGGPVEVRVTEREGEVLVSVTDHGSGISDEDLPHVFERFRQCGQGRGRASIGLGLYIVRGLVEAHGGRVSVRSTVGRGSTFTFSLPRRRHGEPEGEEGDTSGPDPAAVSRDGLDSPAAPPAEGEQGGSQA